MKQISTPHISSNSENFEIAETVLMPGDPLRAKFIAENFLDEFHCINSVRNMLGFTGKFKNKKITVMAHGMGNPSMAIYSYELFNFFGVQNIIRIGSAGALSNDLKIGDIVAGMGVCTDSNYANQYNLPGSFSPICSYDLLKKSEISAQNLNISLKIGNILSSDVFYDDLESLKKWQYMGVLACEMEAMALYCNAAKLDKKALCLLTISDTPLRDCKPLSTEERRTSFLNMIKISLNLTLM